MENNEIKKYNCKFCNYTTKYPCEWIKHTETDKHQRQGKKKIHKCEACDYETFSKWNMDIHHLSSHATKEEREKQKYYCKDCDQVFFCKLYKESHMNGKKHKNVVKANKLVEEMNNINNI
jgi:hypothetical protein